MTRRIRSFLICGYALLGWMAIGESSVSAQNVIVYGNARSASAAANQMNAAVRQYQSPQNHLPQNSPQGGYSVVVPHSRVTAFDRLNPQPYRGAGQRAPVTTYGTQQGGIYYGTAAEFGYGVTFNAQPTGGYMVRKPSRPNARNRIFPGR